MPVQPKHYDTNQKRKIPDFELQYKRDTHLKKVKLHHHDFYELFFLVTGDVTYTIESKLCHVIPGDILMVSPKELHQLRIDTKMEEYERYVLWINPRYLRALSTEKTDLLRCLDSSREGYRNRLRMNPEGQNKIYQLIARLYEEMQQDSYGSDILKENLFLQLLIAINRAVAEYEAHDEDMIRSSQVVSEVVAYISEHYQEPLSLEGLAEQFFVSKYHLSHEFNRLVGTGIHRYIMKKRLLIARQFIAQGHKLKDVWQECGFGDYTVFYRAFKSEYDMSPREYEQAVKQAE